MKAYDEDLRTKVLDYLDKNGGTKVQACKTFGIGKNTLLRWLKLRKETGEVKAKVRENKPRKVDYGRLQALLVQQPDATLRELANPFGMSPRGVAYALSKIKATRTNSLPLTHKPIQKNDENSSD